MSNARTNVFELRSILLSEHAPDFHVEPKSPNCNTANSSMPPWIWGYLAPGYIVGLAVAVAILATVRGSMSAARQAAAPRRPLVAAEVLLRAVERVTLGAGHVGGQLQALWRLCVGHL